MFKIAICDDEPFICSMIENAHLDNRDMFNKNIEIEIFYSGETLCNSLEKENHYDLIFLDIELKLLNGIEVGKKIREDLKDDTMQIVYISASQKYVMELFQNRPLQFLIKPLKISDIVDCTNKAISISFKYNECFEFMIKKSFHKIKYKYIIYFESKNKKIRIITPTEIYEFYDKMNNVVNLVPSNEFFYIHKSFLVNYAYIKDIYYNYAVLTNGKSLPISQGFRQSVKCKLLKRWQINLENN